MTTALRPLSTGELLDRTFSLYRSHFGLFVGIFALPYLVVLAFRLVGLVFQSPTPQISNILMNLVWSMGALFLILIVSAASQAAAVVAVSNLHLDRPASVMDSFSTVKGEIPGVIGVSLLVGMASGVAFLAFIVPGAVLLHYPHAGRWQCRRRFWNTGARRIPCHGVWNSPRGVAAGFS